MSSTRAPAAQALLHAVRELREHGLSIRLCPDAELAERLAGGGYSARNYWSRAVASVPFLMGGARYRSERPGHPWRSEPAVSARAAHAPCVLTSTERPPAGPPERPPAGTPEETPTGTPTGTIDFALGATLGKPLHIAHLLCLTFAHLGATLCGGAGLVLLSNDTGPRVAGMLARIARARGIPPAEAASGLQRGLVSADEIVTSYRTRVPAEHLTPEETLAARTAGLLGVMERRVEQALSRLQLLPVRIVRESEMLTLHAQPLVEEAAPTWAGSGFATMPGAGGLVIVERDGEITSAGMLMACLRELAPRDAPRSLCLMESMRDGLEAVSALQHAGHPVLLAGGAGVSLQFELGSGTRGDVPDMHELLDWYPEDLCARLAYFVLTRPLCVGEDPAYPLASRHFDFTDRDAIRAALEQCGTELVAFREHLTAALLRIERAAEARGPSVASDPLITREIAALGSQVRRVLESPPSARLAAWMRLRPLRESPAYHEAIQRAAFLVGSQDEAIALLIRVLAEAPGRRLTLREFFAQLAQTHTIRARSRPQPASETHPIRSACLDAAHAQGYREAALITRAREYATGALALRTLLHPAQGALKRLLAIDHAIERWPADAAWLAEAARRLWTLLGFCPPLGSVVGEVEPRGQ